MINNAWLSIFGKRESPSEHTRGIRHFSFHAEGQQGSMDVPTAHNTRKQTCTHTYTKTHTRRPILPISAPFSRICVVVTSGILLKLQTSKCLSYGVRCGGKKMQNKRLHSRSGKYRKPHTCIRVDRERNYDNVTLRSQTTLHKQNLTLRSKYTSFCVNLF